jgi:hypothetical protein
MDPIYALETNWNTSHSGPLPEYDANFDPSCLLLSRLPKNTSARSLLNYSKKGMVVPKNISLKKLRKMQSRSDKVKNDMNKNPWDGYGGTVQSSLQSSLQASHGNGNGNGNAGSINKNNNEPSKTFSILASAFDFKHHPNTSPTLELTVLKNILTRESIITKLYTLINVISESDDTLDSTLNGSSQPREDTENNVTSTIKLLTELRNVTVLVIKSIGEWRLSDASSTPSTSSTTKANNRMFLYHHQNYLLKLTSDIDFLGTCTYLVEAMKVSADRLVANPLMLPNTLTDGVEAYFGSDASSNPFSHVDDLLEGSKYTERIGLRECERVLCDEIKERGDDGFVDVGYREDEDGVYYDDGGDGDNENGGDNDDDYGDDDDFVKDDDDVNKAGMKNNRMNNNMDEFSSVNSNYSLATEQSEAYTSALSNWYDQAQAQLLALSQPISGPSKFNSRDLGNNILKSSIPGTANFMRVPENYYPKPMKLTELINTSVDVNNNHKSNNNNNNNNNNSPPTTIHSGPNPNISLSIPNEYRDFGESTYNPSAVPPPVQPGQSREDIAKNARRKSQMMPKGPKNVKSKLFAETGASNNGDAPLGLRDVTAPAANNNATKGGTGGKVVVKRIKKKRDRPPMGLDGSTRATSTKEPVSASTVASSMTSEDIKNLTAIENPTSPALAMVAAAVVILLDNKPNPPSDVSWGAFKKLLNGNSFVTDLLMSTEPSQISGFKAAALRRFLQDDKFTPKSILPLSLGGAKLASWVFILLSNVPEFEWPEHLLLADVLDGMDEHWNSGGTGGGGGGGNNTNNSKGRNASANAKSSTSTAKKQVPPPKTAPSDKTKTAGAAKPKTAPEVKPAKAPAKKDKPLKPPTDVHKMLYTGEATMGGASFVVSIFDTVSKSFYFVKAYNPITSEEMRLTVPLPSHLVSIAQIESYAKGKLLSGVVFVPGRLGNRGSLEWKEGAGNVKKGGEIKVEAGAVVEKKLEKKVVETNAYKPPVVEEKKPKVVAAKPAVAAAKQPAAKAEPPAPAAKAKGPAPYIPPPKQQPVAEAPAPAPAPAAAPAVVEKQESVADYGDDFADEDPAEEPVEEPAEEPAEEPVKEPVEEPVEEPVASEAVVAEDEPVVSEVVVSEFEQVSEVEQVEEVKSQEDAAPAAEAEEEEEEVEDYEEEFEAESPKKPKTPSKQQESSSSPKRPKTADSDDGYGDDGFDDDFEDEEEE